MADGNGRNRKMANFDKKKHRKSTKIGQIDKFANIGKLLTKMETLR